MPSYKNENETAKIKKLKICNDRTYLYFSKEKLNTIFFSPINQFINFAVVLLIFNEITSNQCQFTGDTYRNDAYRLDKYVNNKLNVDNILIAMFYWQ